MKRSDDHLLTRHSLNLYAGDYAKIQGLFPPRIGAAKAIRDIVRAFIRKTEEEAAQRVDLQESIDIEIRENENVGTQ